MVLIIVLLFSRCEHQTGKLPDFEVKLYFLSTLINDLSQ